jgi:hypothetical protein
VRSLVWPPLPAARVVADGIGRAPALQPALAEIAAALEGREVRDRASSVAAIERQRAGP